MAVAYTKTDTAITVVIDFSPKTIPSSHPNFQKIVTLAKKGATKEADIVKLIDIPKAIETFTGGNVTVVNGRLFYKGFEVKNSLASVILGLVKVGDKEGAKPFELFMESAFRNPDRRAVDDLYDWVVHSKLPITPDGRILAWKAVRGDYTSIHGGGFDHHIGNTVQQDRSLCDANPERTCSSGLHFCSGPYLKSYASGGSRIVAVAIEPEHVVAFPTDYGWEKGRACKYEVVGEIPLDQVPNYYHAAPIYDWKAPAKAQTKAKKSAAVKAKTAGGISVGQYWTDGQGNKVKITSINEKSEKGFIVRGDNNQTYTGNGRYYGKDVKSDRDLLKLVK